MNRALIIICFFTFLIHLTESLAYSMRLAGLRTKQIAIALSFVTSTLLVSRLSNMFQAPILGALVDNTILAGTLTALKSLQGHFRIIILFAFLGSLLGAFLTPTMVFLFQKAVIKFLHNGSLPRTALSAFYPRNMLKIIKSFRLPKFQAVFDISLKNIPKTFLVLNMFVASIYTIGVLCSLLAGAYLPTMRATAIQLSGIVNGIATIMFTIFVDPAGARITDQASNGLRPQDDVRTVIFFLLLGRLLGTLIIAQLLFFPFTQYIMLVTKFLSSSLM